jgi:hypothetical protein
MGLTVADSAFKEPIAAAGALSRGNAVRTENADSNARSVTDRVGPRRTPRRSLIVVLPENHVVSADTVSAHLPSDDDAERIDVIIACAGQPNSLGALQRRIRDLQILLAPAGTSGEDLRELAMNQAPGDIVTLLSGIPS